MTDSKILETDYFAMLGDTSNNKKDLVYLTGFTVYLSREVSIEVFYLLMTLLQIFLYYRFSFLVD